MKSMSLASFAAVLVSLAGAQAEAADAAPPAAAPAAQAMPLEADAVDAKAVKEPYVQRTVIEGKTVHIEELRVRGQLQKVTVSPKGGGASYEILTESGSRDLLPSPSNSLGASGQRVWNVFHF
jgi:hypothetical protein